MAQSIASKLVQNNLSTPRPDKIHNNLFLDENKNVMVTLEIHVVVHIHSFSRKKYPETTHSAKLKMVC